MSSKILSYVDNVVSNYDSGDGEAAYPNLLITQTAAIFDADIETGTVKNLTVGADPNSGISGYSFPVANPSNGDYLAFNGSALEFRSFTTQSIELRNLIGFNLNSTTNGSIAHLVNNDTLTVDPVTEYTIIDGKSTVLVDQLKLTDRLLVSVDLPGSGTNLLKLTLRDLFKFIEQSTTTVSSINSLTSNTGIDADETEISFVVHNGVFDQASKLDSDGLTLNGDLYFTANASMTLINDGFLFSRFANTIDLQFDGTQNIKVKTDEVQLGTGLYIDNATLTVNADATIDQDLATTSNTIFSTLSISSADNATAVGTGALIVSNGGASVAQDLYVGVDVIVNGTSLVSSSQLLKTNINEFTDGLNYIMDMRPVKYTRKNTNRNELGFIAEEMEHVLPVAVSDKTEYKSIAYTQIIPVLVSALQEQQNKITELELKINS